MTRTRYAIVGTGSRAQMYLEAIAGAHAEHAELVAVADTNTGRREWSLARHPALGSPARFAPEDLSDAIARHRVDRVIITSPDHTHAEHIVRTLEAGADAITEKPLTIDEEGVRLIADAVERTGREVILTFNYRYSPRNTALKRVIASGEIGDVTSVHFEWVLDTAHGADYFRRWHRDKSRSGGLLIHKASHHFDLVNWWLADTPARVFAAGGLRFYGAENARRRDVGPRPERGTTDSPLHDPFSLDLRTDPVWRGLYLDQEHFDGYLRDRDVFDEGITIEDNLALVVDYARGSTMSYSLNAHSPWEGYTVSVNGTRGRAELNVVERGSVTVDEGGRTIVDPSARPDLISDDPSRPVGERLMVQPHFGRARVVEIDGSAGGHGGGDDMLLHDVFRGGLADPLGRTADWTDGIRSVAVGLAGNLSLASDAAVRISDLDLGGAQALFSPRAAPARTV